MIPKPVLLPLHGLFLPYTKDSLPPAYESQALGCFLGNPVVRACTEQDGKA